MRNFSIDLVWAKVQTAAAAIGGYLGYFVGGVDGLMTALIIFMVIDYSVDLHVVGTGQALRSAVICFYLSNEGVSVLENAGHLGLPIPEKLKDILAQLHGHGDAKEDENYE